ncbi:MAG: phosphotransferase [Alphaproteobacteria bacterium]|nr:phosphotransferase [Alphaproteobacteria bacterium]
MSAYQPLIDWALAALKVPAACMAEVVVETPWSCVLRIETDAGVFYLKKTPPGLWIEADVLRFCQDELRLDITPRLIASDRERGCFLMQSCGDMTLRTYFEGKLDTAVLCRGIETYRLLGDAAAPHHGTLLKIGLPDWRLANLPAVFDDLVQHERFLKTESLETSEIANLRRAQKPLAAACAALAGIGVSDTLCHCDFHDNNITIDRPSGKTFIIDLGETAICHPFLPLSSLLRRMGGRYELSDGDPRLTLLQAACFEGWGITPPEKARAEALAESLAPLFYALSYIRLAAETPDINDKAPRMQGRIAAGLREVIDRLG